MVVAEFDHVGKTEPNSKFSTFSYILVILTILSVVGHSKGLAINPIHNETSNTERGDAYIIGTMIPQNSLGYGRNGNANEVAETSRNIWIFL